MESAPRSYRLVVPDSWFQLLISFSTPVVELVPQMQELFDAITGTLSWCD
jgi:hypothetical protein